MSENLEDDGILNMSEAELDRHLRANGIDPDGLLPRLVKHLKLKLEEDLPDRSRINLLTALVSIQSQQISEFQKDWTPISKGLPEINKPFQVTITDSEISGVETCAHRGGIWFRCDARGELIAYLLKTEKVSAYRPLPSAYEGEGK